MPRFNLKTFGALGSLCATLVGGAFGVQAWVNNKAEAAVMQKLEPVHATQAIHSAAIEGLKEDLGEERAARKEMRQDIKEVLRAIRRLEDKNGR